jgi:hypothetical protein
MPMSRFFQRSESHSTNLRELRSRQKKHQPRRQDSSAIHRAVCEICERRVLLTAALDAMIPTSIAPNSAPQTLLGGGETTYTMVSNSLSTAVHSSYRFVLNNASANQSITFSTGGTNTSFPDAAIALYDSNGNRIALQDADNLGGDLLENLTTPLQSNQPYTVAFYAIETQYFGFGSPSDFINMQIYTGAQSTGDTVTFNPATASGSLTTSSAPDAFTSSTQVRLFPISLLDAGQSATITLAQTNPDTALDATLFSVSAANGLWTPVSTTSLAAGTAFTTMTVTPPSGGDITDGTYVLEVAPAGFTSSAEPVAISVTSTVLLPATVSPANAHLGIAESLTSPGVLSGSATGSFTTHAGALGDIIAPLTGPMTLTFTPTTSYEPLLGVYGPGGTPVLSVTSSTVASTALTTTFNVVAGSSYFFSLGPDDTSTTGSFTISASQSYTPTAIAVGSSIGTQTLPTVANSNGVVAFQLTPPVGSNYVAIQLAPTAGTLQPELQIVGPNLTARNYFTTPGQPDVAIIDESQFLAPYDVLVNGVGGTGSGVTLKYVALTTPTYIAVNQFPTSNLNLTTGGLVSSSFAAMTGTSVGVQYYQSATNAPLTLSTYSTNASGGASAVMLHYVLNGSTFQLAEAAVPGLNVIASATDVAEGQTLHALVALPVNFSGTGTVQLSVAGPIPKGTALAEVPNAIPGQNISNYQSTVSVTEAILTTSTQLDLYSVQLPFNMTSTNSSLTFTPATTGGPLHATVSILNSSNGVLGTATNTAGQPVSIPVSALTVGETLRFLVQPVAGSNVGSGGYSLSMTVNTGNPLPYLVTETSFDAYVAPGSQVAGQSYFPNVAPTVLNFGTSGVSTTASFTSSVPYNNNGTGSIQVFELTGFTAAIPFQVYTTDNTTSVDTNFALFQVATTNSSSGATSFTKLPGTAPSFDYYPGDRTQVDAKIVVNNIDLDPTLIGGEFPESNNIYVVVMNEQGSEGGYTLTAMPVTTTTTGPGVTSFTPVIPVVPTGDSAYIAPALETVNGTTYDTRVPAEATSPESLIVKTNDGSTGETITLRVSKFGSFVPPTPITGTVGTGGIATFSLSLLKSTGYTVQVSSSTLPLNGLDMWLAYSETTTTSPFPAVSTTTNVPIDAGYNSTLPRIDPGPDGSIAASYALSGGAFSTIFTVETPGQIQLHVTYPTGSSNVDVALYQSGQQPSGSNASGPFNPDGVLVDYSNAVDGNGQYSFNEFLEPGTYFLRGTGTGSGTVSVTGTIPAVLATVLNVEPSTGMTFDSEDSILNHASGESSTPVYDFPFVYQRYSTFYYGTTIPADASGQPISVEAYDVPTNTDTTTSAGSAGAGTVSLTLWRFANGVYTNVGTQTNALNDHNLTDFPVTGTDTPVAGAVYFIGVDLNGFAGPIYISLTVPVTIVGKPDYSVTPLQLLPDFGYTISQTTIVNGSFTLAPPTTYTIKLGGTTVTRSVPALAPFGTYLISTPWTPLSPSDTSQVVVNPIGAQVELSAANDTTNLALLSNVDGNIPTVMISLADAAMTAEGSAGATTGGGTWGRYISGVSGQISTIDVMGMDLDTNLIEIDVVGPMVGSSRAFAVGADLNDVYSDTVQIPIDFGTLNGTSPTNPNQIQFYAVDAFGLRTPTYIQTLDVAKPPTFLTGGVPAAGNTGAGGTITFNASNHTFTYKFQDSIISLSDTLSQLLDFDVPVIGDDSNAFLVDISGTGTGGFSPGTNVQLALTGEAKLVALNDTLFDKTYSNYNATSNVIFTSAMTLNGASLVPGSVQVNMTLKTLPIQTYNSPLIPILSFGVPGVASVDAGIKFGVTSNISGGVTLGLDPTGVSGVEGYLGAIGVMSPTFIQPSIMGTASVVGQVSVLGYDVADLSGSVALTLTLTLGLDNSVADAVIPFSQAVDDLAITVDAKLQVSVSASIWGFNVFSYNLNKDYGNIVNTVTHGIYLTNPPMMGAGEFIGPGGAPIVEPDDDPTAVISTGSSLVGAYTIDPSPQIVINNTSGGMGLSVQVANVGSTNAPQGNLVVATRANTSSGWTTGTSLSENNDVASPVLALSHDGSAGTNPAVVVYDVDDATGSPSTQTLNQRLDSFDIAYRYFNGTSWSGETRLTSDSLYDSEQSIAFGSTGSGVLAYVHNTDTTPISVTSGTYDDASNDIYASVWNPTTHAFGAPVAITHSDGIADAQPTTFVDSSGKMYIVWIRTTASGSQLWYSTNTGSGWSAAAQLGVTGLAPGGTFKNVAIGSDGTGRVNVLFSYESPNADGSLTTALYQRPATTAGFTNSLPAVQIGANADYSGLKVTNNPTGGLVAYWEQSDGQMNQIFESTITSGVSTTPTQVSDDPNIAMEPSAAVDTNNVLQVLYDNTIIYGGTSQGSPTDPSVGAPLAAGVASSSIQMLPQLTFINGLAFPVEAQSAPVGSTITGTALIANRGLTSTTLTITAYDGLPSGGTTVGTAVTITLLPGGTYNYSQAFTVLAGNQTYSVQLTTSSGQAFDTTENLSTTTLSGLPDIVAGQLTTPQQLLRPGLVTTLNETFTNASTVAIGAFTVTLYSGDPLTPQFPLTVLGTQQVSSLAASAQGSLTWNITVPSGAGDDIYTTVVDSANVITESNETNNESRIELLAQADPAIYDPGTGAVVATLLNSNNSGNVQVVVNVENNGAVSLFNLPVDLLVSRNGGAYTSDGQIVIPELDSGASVQETFTITALGGDNVFVGEIDSSVSGEDSNLDNNSGTSDLFVPGVPTLSATLVVSSGTSAAGGPLTLTANVSNSGLGDATSVPYLVLASLTSGGPSYIVGSATSNVTAMGSQLVPISLNTTGLIAGTYTLTFEIDPTQSVVQGSEAGNIATIQEIITTGTFTLSGPNEYLRLDADGKTLDIWNATAAVGQPDQQIALASINGLAISAPSGSENVTVDFSNGDPLPSSGMAFTGPSGGTNILNIDGSTGNDIATVNGSSVVFADAAVTAAINYSNLSSISFNGSAGADTLNQTAQPGGGAGLVFVSPNASSMLNVSGGQFTFPASASGSGFNAVTVGSVTIGNGAVIAMSSPNGIANRSVLILNTITLTGTGTLDLSSNDLIVHSMPLSTLAAYVKAGYNNGGWNGNGITSSAATATANLKQLNSLGIVSNDLSSGQLYGTGTALGKFDGQSPLQTDVLVKFTYYGDSNLDGKVDGSDYSRTDSGSLSQHTGTPLTGWYNGDFNYDGIVNGSDYTLIDNAYNTQGIPVPDATIAAPTSQTTSTANQSTAAKVSTARKENRPTQFGEPSAADVAKPSDSLFSTRTIYLNLESSLGNGPDANSADELLKDVFQTDPQPGVLG